MLDLLLCIIDAGHTKREWKVASIEEALRSIEKAKILIRLSYELRQIGDRRCILWQEWLDKAGRMLGGWKRSI